MQWLNYVMNDLNTALAIAIGAIIFATIIFLHVGVGFWLGWVAGVVMFFWNLIVWLILHLTFDSWIDLVYNSSNALVPPYIIEPAIFGIIFASFSIFGLIMIILFRKLVTTRMREYRSLGISVKQDRYIGVAIAITAAFPTAFMATTPLATSLSGAENFDTIYRTVLNGVSLTNWTSIASNRERFEKYYEFITYEETSATTNEKHTAIEAFVRVTTLDVENLNDDLIDIYNTKVTPLIPEFLISEDFIEFFMEDFDRLTNYFDIDTEKISAYDSTNDSNNYNYSMFDDFKTEFEQKFGDTPDKKLNFYTFDMSNVNVLTKTLTDIMWTHFIDKTEWKKQTPGWREHQKAIMYSQIVGVERMFFGINVK